MTKFSYINNADPKYIDSLYKKFLENPLSVDEEWRKFFEGFEFARNSGFKAAETSREGVDPHRRKEVNVLNLINGYRSRGHFFTKTNPVRERRKYTPTLDVENFGLSKEDLEVEFHAGNEIGIGTVPLKKIIEHLQETYCRSIGAEYMFIRQPERVEWLQNKMEYTRNMPQFSKEEKLNILKKLTQAVVFESFLHTKYVGQKRFALSGGETIVAGLDAILEKGAALGIEEFVIGMAHRGRLNILANILNKEYEQIFAEFEGEDLRSRREVESESIFEGDVKYHLGFSNDVRTRNGKEIHLSLSPNPSHLEAVDPIVQGIARAKIDKRYNGDIKKLAPILIHGDAAIAAQGIVYEVIQMSLLEAHKTGGTIHLVINNQLGFTTNYLQGRSSIYCTDVAKVTRSPVFHVNADDVEAVVFAIQMAMEYRQEFHTDVFIDLLGYRRYGHNEADEPRFTQPKLYKIIEKHPDPREIYLKNLIGDNEISQSEAEDIEAEFRQQLNDLFNKTKSATVKPSISSFEEDWEGLRRPSPEDFDESPDTQVSEKNFSRIAEKVFQIPSDAKVFKKIRRLYDTSYKNFVEKKSLNWGMAELMAYGTLVDEGVSVRLSGQDSERGTFAHRHAVLKIEESEENYVPLNHVNKNQAKFEIYNSLLSEYGVLGFEMGYAWSNPAGLTIWEAQFGDFVNGAQIVIDQYLSCSEIKWRRMNGLVLYLPHGYEGQGPEHSSARMERFLNLCAYYNMQVVNCSTPANFFHVLRRQTKFPFRIPLIILTPKSLLRHPKCISPIEDFIQNKFQEIIDDQNVTPDSVDTILLCSGKIYYELLERQQEEEHYDVAIIRLEQVYPLPYKQIQSILNRYHYAKNFIWVQEEPRNMGAWPFLMRRPEMESFDLIARKASPTPATGYYKQYLAEQKEIIDRAFDKMPLNHRQEVDKAVIK
jgi:2-oxoglutarate dehydrogenase E1 component